MSPEAIIIAIMGAVVSVISAVLAAMAAVKRVKSQNTNDDASAVALFEKAAANRQIENDQLRAQINEITIRMQKLETAISGPFRIILEFTTSPELKISRAEIEILTPEQVKIAADATAAKSRH